MNHSFGHRMAFAATAVPTSAAMALSVGGGGAHADPTGSVPTGTSYQSVLLHADNPEILQATDLADNGVSIYRQTLGTGRFRLRNVSYG